MMEILLYVSEDHSSLGYFYCNVLLVKTTFLETSQADKTVVTWFDFDLLNLDSVKTTKINLKETSKEDLVFLFLVLIVFSLWIY